MKNGFPSLGLCLDLELGSPVLTASTGISGLYYRALFCTVLRNEPRASCGRGKHSSDGAICPACILRSLEFTLRTSEGHLSVMITNQFPWHHQA